jgi:hypothetical protein
VNRPALGLALLLCLLALPSSAAAQESPACTPDQAMDARITAQEDETLPGMVATHEVEITADVADRDAASSSPATRVVITPEAGVEVLARSSGGGTIIIFAPSAPTLAVTVSWRQSTDPENFGEERCSGSSAVTLPVRPATRARGARQPNPGPPGGDYTFAVAAAEARKADLRPLVVSIRSTARARFPRANERLRTWTIPMRTREQVKYRGSLPNPAYATTPQMCRFWWLFCGPAFARVYSLNVDDKALNRRIERPDLDGSNSILRGLAYSQPSRWASPYGILIQANPGVSSPQLYGYDIQVRQAEVLLARVRRSGRCENLRVRGGIRDFKCRLFRSKTLLR